VLFDRKRLHGSVGLRRGRADDGVPLQLPGLIPRIACRLPPRYPADATTSLVASGYSRARSERQGTDLSRLRRTTGQACMGGLKRIGNQGIAKSARLSGFS